MARTELTVQTTARTGLAPSYTAAIVDGHAFNNDGERIFLHVKNTGGSAVTVTVQTPKTLDGLAVTDLTVSVPATTGDRMIGPFPSDLYALNDTTLSIKKAIWVDYSATTGVTIAAVKLGMASY